MTSAVVIGSGPNGLSAAVVLAQAGIDVTVLEAEADIGGGTRSAELTVPGLLHDVCSAAHPIGVASPFLRTLDLDRHGLEWAWAEIEATHPLDDGRAGVLWRDVDRTAAHLGPDGAAWHRLFAPLAARADRILPELLGPVAHLPRHPVHLARFGSRALAPASLLARRWDDDPARALFAGMAAHAFRPLGRPPTGALGLLFGMLGHDRGWPVAVGGSASITRALAAILTGLGGRIETGHRVTELPAADVVLFDTSPDQALAIAGDRLPRGVSRALRRFRHGPASFKVDLAVDGGVPWRDPWSGSAGTVHVGGRFEEVAAAEAAVVAGRMPERPFVLVCQQYLADPGRSVGDVHPVWAYAHVPHGWSGDATEHVLRQLERFAPGVRDRVVASAVSGPADLAAHNANYVGGDISGGANTMWQTLVRPRFGPDPYSLGVPGLYLCSASTAPGAGVHGMAGFHAATRAVRSLGAEAARVL